MAGGSKVYLLTLGAALPKCGERIAEEQEILGALADIAIVIYPAESALLRALKGTYRV